MRFEISSSTTGGASVATNRRQDVLAGLLGELLPALSGDTLAALLDMARVRRFERGDRLLRQDEESAVVLILEGHAVIWREGPEGQRLAAGILQPGSLFGFESVRSRTVAPADIVALTEGGWAEWPGLSVRRLAESDAALALGLFDRSVDWLLALHERLVQTSFDLAGRRLARSLLVYEELLRRDPPPINRTELAGLVGVTREMLGQILRRLEARQVVRRRGAAIEILDRDVLIREAEDRPEQGT